MIHLFVLIASVALAGSTEHPESATLLSSLLFGNQMSPEAILPNVAPDMKQALARYRTREGEFKAPEPMQLDGPEKYLRNKRAGIQRSIFSLHDRPDALKLATDFTANVQLLYEWEGMSDSPLSEAKSAAAFLKSHPKTPLASYVHLFIGHREKCALAFNGGREGSATELSKDANAQLEQAVRSKNTLIQAAAKHLIQNGGCYPP